MTTFQIYAIMKHRHFSDCAITLYLMLRELRNEKHEIDFTYADFKDVSGKCARTFTEAIQELGAGRLVTRLTKSRLWVCDLPAFSEEESLELICEKGLLFRKMCLSMILFNGEPINEDQLQLLEIANQSFGREGGPTLEELREQVVIIGSGQPNIRYILGRLDRMGIMRNAYTLVVSLSLLMEMGVRRCCQTFVLFWV